MATTTPAPTHPGDDLPRSAGWQAAADYPVEWVQRHVEDERRQAGLLSEAREAIFGAQDGLISTLAVVSTVGGATAAAAGATAAAAGGAGAAVGGAGAAVGGAGAAVDAFPILVAGLASALAGVFSMSAGEYMSSKSQREIFAAQIAGEAEEVEARPAEAEAEVAYMLQAEGLGREAALRVARELASAKPVLLKTMVEKELGLSPGEEGSPLRGAAVMGSSFGLAALVPILPYLLLPVGLALVASVAATGLALFAMGALKSRWTQRHWLPSGAEILLLGTLAGVVGYAIGTGFPALLGVAGVGR